MKDSAICQEVYPGGILMASTYDGVMAMARDIRKRNPKTVTMVTKVVPGAVGGAIGIATANPAVGVGVTTAANAAAAAEPEEFTDMVIAVGIYTAADLAAGAIVGAAALAIVYGWPLLLAGGVVYGAKKIINSL
jgi:hypothetical protein